MIFILFIILLLGLEHYSNIKWQKQPLKNFPFRHKGKTFWYSRSVATTIGVFCKNANGEWCVLANKRGEGAPDFQGFWNIVCGYLEHDVTGEENCQKEVFEETGINIPISSIVFQGVNTNPSENRQNVSLRYIAILDDCCENYVLSDKNSEENEVSDIKWIPLSNIDKYSWAFNHNLLIKQMSQKNNLNNEVA